MGRDFAVAFSNWDREQPQVLLSEIEKCELGIVAVHGF